MSFQFQRAAHGDDRALKHLFRITPQPGPVTLVFEREPDFFAASELLVTDPCMWLVRDTSLSDFDSNVVGLMSVGSRPVFVDGEKKDIRYISDLRVHPDYRSGTLLARIFRQGKKEIEDLDEWAQTVILDDNEVSKNSITGGRGGLPFYFPRGALNSYYINNGRTRAGKRKYGIRRAMASDVELMQEFFDNEAKRYQGFPVYDFSEIQKGNRYYLGQGIEDYYLAFDGNELAGIVGVWDQGTIKQIRFKKYNGIYKWLRPVANGLGYLGGIQGFPREGEVLKYKYMHCVLVKDDSVEVFDDLLGYVVHEYCNRREALLLGLMDGSPLNECAKKYRHRVTRSLHYLVSWGADPSPGLDKNLSWYLEAARL